MASPFSIFSCTRLNPLSKFPHLDSRTENLLGLANPTSSVSKVLSIPGHAVTGTMAREGQSQRSRTEQACRGHGKSCDQSPDESTPWDAVHLGSVTVTEHQWDPNVPQKERLFPGWPGCMLALLDDDELKTCFTHLWEYINSNDCWYCH